MYQITNDNNVSIFTLKKPWLLSFEMEWNDFVYDFVCICP